MDEGIYEIGHRGEGFHFDNECDRHKVYLNAFSIDKALVTNGEYLAFLEDGGYDKFQYWLDDGWHWLRESGIRAPLYWRHIDGQWHYYTLDGLKPVNPDALLCHVSYYEANAYASWQGKRLPTEFEWEAAADQLPWGKRWEWTNSAYLPYPGFRISADAVGEYNGKFMINQMVLRGASRATPDNHSRKTYRNFFHPHLQWQFSGIRLAT
jgi:formylglycine-generating enzyme required for sulfatase activity